MSLPSRWFEYPEFVQNHEGRKAYSKALIDGHPRVVVNHSGRRSFKTECCKRALVATAMREADKNFVVMAPTNAQVKRIYLKDIKDLIPPSFLKRYSTVDQTFHLINGTTIVLAAAEASDRIEGMQIFGAVLDEFGKMGMKVLEENLLPALAATKGFLWIVGVPEGMGNYYTLVQEIKMGKWGGPDEAVVFSWPSEGMIDPDEIAKMKERMDPLTFDQEFLGEFVSFEGRAYHAFSHDTNVREGLRERYDPTVPLVLAMDFNVSPGTASIIQPMEIDGRKCDAVIGEVYIDKNSHTEMVTRNFCEQFPPDVHKSRLHLYGDFFGGSRGSAQLRGSDWDIVKQTLQQEGYSLRRVIEDIPRNPRVKERVNSMNARLRNAAGESFLFFDSKYTRYSIRDMEGVKLLPGTAFEIDKKSAPDLTHISDAIGYYIHRLYPVKDTAAEKFRISNLH